MPAYSFKKRFVPLVKKRKKRQTIRSKRKYQVKKGDTLYLYYGMRTKYCEKIGQEVCKDVEEITISENGDVNIGGYKYSYPGKIALAIQDGFSSKKDKKGILIRDAWQEMFRFWKQTHSLPFIGDIIYW